MSTYDYHPSDLVPRVAYASAGTVRMCQLRAVHRCWPQAAIEAVKQWRYKPSLLNGLPVEIDLRITINFTTSRD
jgi:protein TonB